jgi:hypothetical protein
MAENKLITCKGKIKREDETHFLEELDKTYREMQKKVKPTLYQ